MNKKELLDSLKWQQYNICTIDRKPWGDSPIFLRTGSGLIYSVADFNKEQEAWARLYSLSCNDIVEYAKLWDE